MKVAILSNVTVSILPSMIHSGKVYIPDGFNTWIEESLSPSKGFLEFSPELIFVLLDGRSCIENKCEISVVENSITELSSRFPSATIVFSLPDFARFKYSYFIDETIPVSIENEWSSLALRLAKKKANVKVFDMKELVAQISRERFYDKRMSYLASMPWSYDGMRVIAKKIDWFVRAFEGKSKKVLAIDFDNTLWSGEAGGEVKAMADKESLPYVDMQAFVKSLKENGVLLVGLSKNNEADTDAIWQRGDMILAKEDFVAIKSNWESKVDNLMEVASMLNLSQDSFVFIDDSKIERDEMKSRLPEVAVPDFPGDVSQLEAWMLEVATEYFPKVGVTKEDARRTEMYASNVAREKERAKLSIDDYLKSLEIKVSVSSAKEEDVVRLSQLSLKTNQFNVSAMRYNEQTLRKMLNEKNTLVFSASLKDKFGDEGIVALVVVEIEDDVAAIKEFVMSCRVMKRTVEFAVLEKLESILKEKGVKKIFAKYVKSEKNAPVEFLFDECGFSLMKNEHEEKEYVSPIPREVEKTHFCEIVD